VFSTNTMCGPCARVGFTFTNQRLPPCFFAPCTEDFHDISSSMLVRVRSLTRELEARAMPALGHGNIGLMGNGRSANQYDMQFRRKMATSKQTSRSYVLEPDNGSENDFGQISQRGARA
jgi:hypothetical protein